MYLRVFTAVGITWPATEPMVRTLRACLDSDAVAILSPHLDDAVLSCGALMAERFLRCRETTVVTVFAGQPEGTLSTAAKEFHKRCGYGRDAVTVRQLEDDKALSVVAAHSVRLHLPEALYRRNDLGEPRYPHISDTRLSSPADEPELIDELTALLASLPAIHAAHRVVAPLAIGDHIDHQMVAAAARRIVTPESLYWYEDVPYLLDERCAGWQTRIGPEDPEVLPFGDVAWSKKLAAIACYRSQHKVLWQRPGQWRTDLTSFVVDAYGSPAERYWKRA